MALSVGLLAEMDDPAQPADDYIDGGFALLGIEQDEVERAVIGGAHALFWPEIRALIDSDLGEEEPERNPDLSAAPAEGRR